MILLTIFSAAETDMAQAEADLEVTVQSLHNLSIAYLLDPKEPYN